MESWLKSDWDQSAFYEEELNELKVYKRQVESNLKREKTKVEKQSKELCKQGRRN